MIFLTNFPNTNPNIIDGKYISAPEASAISGYNYAYLRRLVRNGKLNGQRVGQVWLVDFDDLLHYVENAKSTSDRRFGPQILIVQKNSERFK